MFYVSGTIESVPYRVGVHDKPVEGELHGCVMGSNAVTSLLSLHEGEEVRANPTQDAVTLSLNDPESVLAFLQQQTNVLSVEGDAPAVDNDPSAIY